MASSARAEYKAPDTDLSPFKKAASKLMLLSQEEKVPEEKKH